MTLRELKEQSICINDRIVITYRNDMGNESRYMEMGESFDRTNVYYVNNFVLGFVHNYMMYVTRFTKQAKIVLRENGFEKQRMFIPLSEEGSYPAHLIEKWNEMWENDHAEWRKQYEEDARMLAEKRGVAPLSMETMRKCFRMPHTGMKVNLAGVEYAYRPKGGTEEFFGLYHSEVGIYDMNNNIIVFVADDGHTYISKDSSVLRELREKGYRERIMYVPFSHGEVIKDPELAKRWNSLPENNFNDR